MTDNQKIQYDLKINKLKNVIIFYYNLLTDNNKYESFSIELDILNDIISKTENISDKIEIIDLLINQYSLQINYLINTSDDYYYAKL